MAFNLDIANYNRLGQVNYACNQAGATVTLINTSTTTGFVLFNPWGSNKKFLILQTNFSFSTVPTATSLVFLCHSTAPISTAPTYTTPLTVYGADGSGASSTTVAKVCSSATTPNLPVYSRILGYAPTTPATTGALTVTDNSDGAFALVPGSYAQISYLGQAPVGVTSMFWVEVPA